MSYIGNAPISAAFLVDTFSGNGSTVAFTMTVAPANTSSIIVAITGVLQDPSTYSVSGTTLTFSAAPPSGTSNISVRYLGIPASGVTTTAYRTVTNTTATASQTSFTIPSYTVGYVDVYRNGVYLPTTDYTATTGTTVVLGTGATSGDTITTISFYVSSVLNAVLGTNGSSTGQTLISPNITTSLTLSSASGTNGQVLTSAGSGNAPTWTTVSNTVFMRAGLGSDQSLTDATVTIANFTGTPSIQIGGTWDTTNKRFTASSITAGYYLVNFNAQFYNASNAGYNASARIYKNGSQTVGNEMTIAGGDIRHASISVSDIVYLANTDYFDFRVYFDVNSGTPVLSGDSFFNFQRLIY